MHNNHRKPLIASMAAAMLGISGLAFAQTTEANPPVAGLYSYAMQIVSAKVGDTDITADVKKEAERAADFMPTTLCISSQEIASLQKFSKLFEQASAFENCKFTEISKTKWKQSCKTEYGGLHSSTGEVKWEDKQYEVNIKNLMGTVENISVFRGQWQAANCSKV